ncbi:MAG: hypothetical protein RR256_06165, partial [Bacteroidales bacterium]
MDKKEKESHVIAGIGTLLVCGLLFLILWFMGLDRTWPPPPEYGVEVNLGFSDQGMGEHQMDQLVQNQLQNNANEPTPDQEQMQTQDEEETVSISSQKQKKMYRKTPKTKVSQSSENPRVQESNTPALNPNALYPGKRNATASSQGNAGGIGDQGKPNGNPEASGYGGSGGNGGISFSVTGRTLKSLARPAYDSEEQGVVVVKIWVNPQGEITRTQVG